MKNSLTGILSVVFFLLSQELSPAQQIADSGLSNKQFEIPDVAGDSSLDYDVSETTVRGFITSSGNEFPIQLGAFRLRINAEAFLAEVKKHVDENAIIVDEDGYFKVRISRNPSLKKSEEPENTQELTLQVSQLENPVPVADTLSELTAAKTDSSKTAEALPIDNNLNNQEQNPAGDIIFLDENNPWLKRINYFGKSIAFVNSLIVTIVVCIATMLILLVVILLNRRRMEKEERLHQYLLEKYQGLIVDYLFGNANPDDFRPIASDNYRRQVLIDQMIDVSVNLKGEEAKKLFSLYKHLGLDRDSIKRANDVRWHKKIKGFRELAFMNIKDANDVIYKALNSSNEILRMEAQIALVRLGDKNPFEFLSHLTRPFSLWEQITLHELIIQHNIPVPPFKQWLKSPNPTVAMFALRMIREFRQKDAEDEVRETMLRPEPEVRQLAVQVAGDLEMRSTLETMKKMYKNQDYNICLEIIKSMGKMPDLSMMGFLKLVLDKEDDVQLQIEATKAIENNGEEGVKALVKLMKSEYKNYNIIVRHVLDRRIF
jgi:hypothetical protein